MYVYLLMLKLLFRNEKRRTLRIFATLRCFEIHHPLISSTLFPMCTLDSTRIVLPSIAEDMRESLDNVRIEN